MVFPKFKNGVTMKVMRIDDDTDKSIGIVRSHLKAMNPAVFTSDNSITKKSLNLYIRQYQLDYLLNENLKDNVKQSEIDILDDLIIKRDSSWKESRNRVDSHVDGEVRESIKEFGNYLFNKEKIDHKPSYGEIMLYLLDFYCKTDKDFINPNLKTKYIIRMEKLRRMKNEQQGIYNT